MDFSFAWNLEVRQAVVLPGRDFLQPRSGWSESLSGKEE